MVTIWIVPSDEGSAKLKTIMTSIQATTTSAESGSYPNFHPHITLAVPPSAFTLQQLKGSIPNPLPNDLQIHFKSIDIGDEFYHSVYIVIEPSSALVSLHAYIHANLDLEPRTALFPHLSLCYITDEDDAKGEQRKQWRNQLEVSGRIRDIGDGVELNCCEGDGAAEDWVTGFTAYEIWFVDCVGPVESWSVLDKICPS